MSEAKFNLKDRKSKAPTLVYMIFVYHKNRLKISTGIKIKFSLWNEERQRAKQRKSFPEHESINDTLDAWAIAIKTAYKKFDRAGEAPSTAELRKEFERVLRGEPVVKPKTKAFDIINELDKFIEEKKSEVAGDTYKDYLSFRKHLVGFQKHRKKKITIAQLDYNFYKDFVKYLSFHAVKPNGEIGLSVNTAGKQIRKLKAFLKDRARRKVIPFIDVSGWKTLSEDADSIYLSEEEIRMIQNLNLQRGSKLDKIRDLFVVGCHTGFRFSDFSNLQPEHIDGDFIEKRTQKQDDYVVVPIYPPVRDVIEKYDRHLPNDISLQEFNQGVKQLGKEAGIDRSVVVRKTIQNKKIQSKHPKYELISSHTCRRSFCTNQFNNGIPAFLIMQISGHSTERNFLKYIKVSKRKAAEKMKEYWKSVQ